MKTKRGNLFWIFFPRTTDCIEEVPMQNKHFPLLGSFRFRSNLVHIPLVSPSQTANRNIALENTGDWWKGRHAIEKAVQDSNA
jgi:hypothetical protein